MASAGLLFLMLMSSSFLISATTDQTQPKEKSLKKNAVKFLSKTLDVIETFVTVASPFMLLLPVHGEFASALLTLLGLGASKINKQINDDALKNIMYEFENLNFKLDEYHADQRWQTWASGAYHKPEIKINQAWKNLQSLVRRLTEIKDSAQKEKEEKFFMDDYKSKYMSATGTLYELLIPKGTSLINPLSNELSEHVKCHEKDLKRYTLLIISLMFKGSLMNELYYAYNKLQPRTEEVNNMLYNTASVLFQAHIKCISDSKKYIENDLHTLIDKTKTRLELVKSVRSFLQVEYDRYDWVVTAYVNKSSTHTKLKVLNSHVLSGFTFEKTKDGITVAVARQVKGSHNKAAEVKEKIDNCIKKTDLCYKVADKLKECRSTVVGKPVSQAYTAVHAYLRETPKEAVYEDYDISTAPEETSNSTPYIYKGDCSRSPGVQTSKFIVFIKSDEEILATDPCSKMNCGKDKGKCVPVKDIFLGFCECKMPYYGENCESNIKELVTQ